MLICSMSVSIDGFIADRDGDFGWTEPHEERFRHSLREVQGLGAYLLGRRLYEAMRVWETEPAMRDSPDKDAFADAWITLPKVVFSRSLDRVEGNARLATGSLADEIEAALALAGPHRDVSIGGADIAGQALELGLLGELRLFRCPVVVGGGTPLMPPVATTIPFELVETRMYTDQRLFERYVRKG
ncbi:MAG: dihydrofolate reductase family protein [Solirubrobacteraceae bacterium]|nr:dihydrofolate reductase family protein [Solirubrobacteraceae bacterium]